MDTDDLNMLPKNLAPEAPPGIDPIIIQSNARSWPTAQITVNGVLWRCRAQYNVAINVEPYRQVVNAFSFENRDLMWDHGPQRKLKLYNKVISSSNVIIKVMNCRICNSEIPYPLFGHRDDPFLHQFHWLFLLKASRWSDFCTKLTETFVFPGWGRALANTQKWKPLCHGDCGSDDGPKTNYIFI